MKRVDFLFGCFFRGCFSVVICLFVSFSYVALSMEKVVDSSIKLNSMGTSDEKDVKSEENDDKSSDITIKIGGEIDFSAYYAKNKDEFEIGSGGHFIDRLYDTGVNSSGSLVTDPSKLLASSKLELRRDHDAGVLGDYTAPYGITNSSKFFIFTENKLNDDVNYGGKMKISVSTGKSRAVSTSEAYVFIGTEYGSFELGTVEGVAERMRLDASTIEAAGSDWFSYNNVEGAYIDAVYDAAVANKSKRNRDVRRPFYILPMLYSEYTHKSGNPWQRHNHSIIGIYPPKVSYYLPKSDSGISFGVSYTHDEAYLYHKDVSYNEREEYKNVIGIGVTYEKALENIKLKLSLTGEKGDYRDDLKNNTYNYYDLLGWNVGAMLGYAGLKFVISFADLYKSGLAKTAVIDSNLNVAVPAPTPVDPGDTKYMTVGIAYEVGPAAISAGYFRSKTSPVRKDAENVLTNYSVSSHYNLSGKAHHLTPYVSFNYFTTSEAFEEDGNRPSYGNNEGYALIGGVRMQF